jgi:leucyl aminopeptidase (aminopeptidase T)
MSKAKVMAGSERKALLLDVGAKLAAKYGAVNITRRMVAKAGKVSDALVSAYFGGTEEARKAYARHAKKLGLEQPSKEKQEALGAKLRAHGPRDARDTRPRSVKEAKAIKRKGAKPVAVKKKAAAKPTTAPSVKPTTAPSVKPAKAPRVKPAVAPVPLPPLNKSAARAPKAPPILPPLPLN